jgi:hypothetical protein
MRPVDRFLLSRRTELSLPSETALTADVFSTGWSPCATSAPKNGGFEFEQRRCRARPVVFVFECGLSRQRSAQIRGPGA